MDRLKRFRIGSIHISITNPNSAIKQICQYVKHRKGGYICVSNMRMVKYAGKHPSYAALMESSLMNLPDGKPLTWLSKFWGIKESACTDGPTLFKSMMNNHSNDIKHCLLGDTEDVLEKIQQKVGPSLVHLESLPFVEVDEFDYEGIAARVKDSGGNIVWTAMRAPKQDEFNARLSALVPGVVCIGVGRAFRLYIGVTSEAPKWARKIGLAGIFTRRTSLYKALQFYFFTFFYLVAYAFDICIRRLRGCPYYE